MRTAIRSLTSEDLQALQRLEAGVFGEDELCRHYLRLCAGLPADACFEALVDGHPVGYLLCFVRDREAYCTSFGLRTEPQRTRVTPRLLAAFVRAIIDRVDVCWLTVKPDDTELPRMLGARQVGITRDFCGPGDERLVSKIDRRTLARLVAA